MSLIMHTENATITTAAGTASTTITANNSILMHIVIKPTTGSTTYDYKLTDIYNTVTYHQEDIRGEENRLIQLPAYGNWTLTIENASADEDFSYMFVFRES